MHPSRRPAPNRRRAAVGIALMTAATVVTACGGEPAPPSASPSPATSVPAQAEPPTQAAPPTTAPPVPPAPVTPRCTAADLRVTLGAAGGAAGSVYRPLVFTNAGGRACELRGFPGVSYVAGDDGHQVGPAAQMSGERGVQVTIPPGGSAAADLQLVQVRNFDPAACRPTPVLGLRVYPPGDTAALFVPAAGTGCAGTPPGPQLSVRTIARS